jgi:ribosomal protein S8
MMINTIGVSVNDIRNALGQQFNSTMINRIIKSLDKKGLIKPVKSIQDGKNKKVWMLMEIEPSSDVTNGLIGMECFDLEVIEVL